MLILVSECDVRNMESPFNSKEGFTTTLVTTQKLIVMQQFENTWENVQYTCGFSDFLGLQLSA